MQKIPSLIIPPPSSPATYDELATNVKLNVMNKIFFIRMDMYAKIRAENNAKEV